MIKKPSFFITLIICIFTFIQALQAAEKLDMPTSVDDRAKVFEQYYLENPDNKDPSVFEHMRKWHGEDFRALEDSIGQQEHKEKLRSVRDSLLCSFDAETVGFTKIALTYATYSLIASSNEDPTRDPEEAETAIQATTAYNANGNPSAFAAILAKQDNLYYIHGRIIFVHDKDLHWLPYVSPLGLASHRTLNDLYGMRAPTLGLPLHTAAKLKKIAGQKTGETDNTVGYDGKLNVPSDEFLRHEVNHGGQFDPVHPDVLIPLYGHYHEANRIVRNIPDLKTRLICDYFLAQLGHEYSFGAQVICQLPHSTYAFPGTLNEACDHTFNSLKADVVKFIEPAPIDYDWWMVKIPRRNLDGTIVPFTQTHDEYYATTSKLVHFRNPQNGHLFTLVDIIQEKKLSRNSVLDDPEVTAPMRFDFLRTHNPQTPEEWELANWYTLQLRVHTYNILIELKEFLNESGISFDIWDGDKFQAEQIISFFQMACDTFKREVEPHMKWDSKSTK